MAERTYTEAELQQRLEWARSAAREQAWRDILRRFNSQQRRHIANLMGHDCTVLALELQDRFGANRGRIEGTVPLDQAVKELDEARQKRRAERAAASGVMASDGSKPE